MLTYDFSDLKEEPLYDYLYRKIRTDILAGHLKPGERMPSKRAFAVNLGISVITVETAYAQLTAEGYLSSRPRSGYYVEKIQESLLIPEVENSAGHGAQGHGAQGHGAQEASAERVGALPPVKEPAAACGASGNRVKMQKEAGQTNAPGACRIEEPKRGEKHPFIDLAQAGADPEMFPYPVWSRLMRETLRTRQRELLERSPGREAYPGDVFYLHSRLLERSAHLSEERGGGSMTALPIIETQAGDVSAYIPTNVISITDGQIYLESNLFFSGQRPAVNVGLSVSRVGGAAQTKAMKQSAGSLRIDLAQFREMEAFTQFSSDLDEVTKRQLVYGQGLMRLLRQDQYKPFSQHQMVILLIAALNHTMVDVPLDELLTYRDKLLEAVETKHDHICRRIDRNGKLLDRDKELLLGEAKAFTEQWLHGARDAAKAAEDVSTAETADDATAAPPAQEAPDGER